MSQETINQKPAQIQEIVDTINELLTLIESSDNFQISPDYLYNVLWRIKNDL